MKYLQQIWNIRGCVVVSRIREIQLRNVKEGCFELQSRENTCSKVRLVYEELIILQT